MSRELDLINKVKEEYVKSVSRGKKRRTLEEALQSALDNTTPEHSGAPSYSTDQGENDSEEWI